MGSTGLIILLVTIAFFTVVGLSATSHLVDDAKNSSDTSTIKATQGVTGTLQPLWLVFIAGILIIGIYCVIHAYSTM
jgi:amino acid transporter